MSILYSLDNVTVRWPVVTGSSADSDTVPALKNLTLDLNANEFVAILGENGSGKSTLAKLLAGFAPDVAGEIYYQGKKVENYGRQAFEDVALVLQEPQYQILMPTVREELAFPLENMGLDVEEIDLRVKSMAEQFGLIELLKRSPEELSGGQITALAIASVLITEPTTIILDEPDSHLDKSNNKELTNFLTRQKHKLSVILITQFARSAQNADHIIIMREGTIAAQGGPTEILNDPALFGARIEPAESSAEDSIHAGQALPEAIEKMPAKFVAFALKNVRFRYPDGAQALANVSIDIGEGEKVALIGPSGSGKSTLGMLAAGLLTLQQGSISISGQPIAELPPQELRRMVTMALQFPERALFEETVVADVAFGPRNLALENIEAITKRYLYIFNLQCLKDRHPFTLSGGEKRKAALAGILAMDTPVVILDEPNAALDPGGTDQLIQFIKTDSARTYLIISHDIIFLSQTCDRVIGLNKGRVVCDLPIGEFMANNEMRAEFDLSE